MYVLHMIEFFASLELCVPDGPVQGRLSDVACRLPGVLDLFFREPYMLLNLLPALHIQKRLIGPARAGIQAHTTPTLLSTIDQRAMGL